MSSFLVEQRCAEAIAREAGRRMLVGQRDGFDISQKGINDVVTNIDREIEEFIVGELAEMFSGDLILGEEFGEQEEEEDVASGTDLRHWYIDPIDGTLNFSHGIPISCVSIALQVDGQSMVGVVYDPYRDEMFSARRGHGAQLNGETIRVSEEDEIGESLLVTGFPPSTNDELETNLQNFAELTRRSRGIRRLGSAALDLAFVAAGRLDGFWEYGLNPWDTAAGYLLVEEAGGRVSQIAAEPFDIFDPSILATNGRIHGDIIDILSTL
ncbi:MAG: inositol monophosphatase family protein [Myxococcota bacterium]